MLFEDPTVAWRNFRRMVLFGVILYLIVPCVATGQPLTIVSDPYPPFGYVKDGEIVGFTVDLIKSLLKRTGIEGEFVIYPWARSYEMAQKEKDILIYQLTYTEKRDRLFQLVGPIYRATDCLWELKSGKMLSCKTWNCSKGGLGLPWMTRDGNTWQGSQTPRDVWAC